MNLENKVVLVTGGSSGIGLETAKKIRLKQAKVIVTGRNRDKLEYAAKANDLVSFNSDISVESDVKRLYDFVQKEFGTLDVLINNAGYGYFDMLEDVNVEKFNEVLQTNVIGAALAAREASKIFKKQKCFIL